MIPIYVTFVVIMEQDLITIMGHTAAGKTRVAALLASELGGEIISADSRQVYRGMDLGTGKDYDDYIVSGNPIPYHLVDIVDAGEEYNVFRFQNDFFSVFGNLTSKDTLPVRCGGSGMYIEAVLRKYEMLHVPVNNELRSELQQKDLSEIVGMLEKYRDLHNRTDTRSKNRAIRALEIAQYMEESGSFLSAIPDLRSLNVAVYFPREARRSRITARLKQRLEQGMIEEAGKLLKQGVSHEKLAYYGLEYRYLSLYLRGELDKEQMFEKLNTAIHQFAKRQMTYFRGMERRGITIHWMNGEAGPEELTEQIVELYNLEKKDGK